MNLVTDPWIPVLHINGDRRLVNLQQIFTEGRNFSDLAVRPHERIALMRLLIAIAQAALDGPNDIDEWDKVIYELPDAGKRYLEDKLDKFDLFHPEQPFLQIVGLSKPTKEKKQKKEADVNSNDMAFTAVSKLDFALATGNNTTLFDHGANGSITRTFYEISLPLMLITYQCFSPGGLISQLRWINHETSKSSKHSPCTPGSMLHTFVRRPTILETLQANLLTREDVTEHWGSDGWGRPVWEWMPKSWDDNDAVHSATHTYLGRMIPLSRFIRLSQDCTGMLLGNGLDYPSFDGDNFPAEPSATVVQNNSGQNRAVLGAGEKAIWRELSALVIRRKQNAIGGALTLRNIPEDKSFDIWVGAFLASKASIEDTIESVLHVPSALQVNASAYDMEVKHAEFIANRLGWAVETWREHEDGGWKGRVKNAGPKKNELLRLLKASAMRHFWTSVEKLCPLLLSHIDTIGTTAQAVEETRARWRKSVWAAAFDAYRLACSQETPRQIRAYSLGLSKLTGESNQDELNTEIEPETEEA